MTAPQLSAAREVEPTSFVRPLVPQRPTGPRARSSPGESRLTLPPLWQLLLFAILAIVAAWALLPQVFAPYLPHDMRADAILAAPGRHHWLGTDQFGRDVFSLIVYGTRRSLLTAVVAVAGGATGGVLLGLLGGYGGRTADALVMRFIDIWMSVPGILLALLITTALGPSLWHTVMAVSLVSIPSYARVTRAQVLAVKRRTFVEASRSLGASHLWIVSRHVLPHCLSPIVVMVTMGVGRAILIVSGLSFLGLGVVDDIPDWGYLLSQGRSYLGVAWWISTFPGLTVTALLVAFNVLGDDLRNRMQTAARA